MPKAQVSQPVYDEFRIHIIGTAPMLVAHPLQWDVPSYWDLQPPEISETKIKRPTPVQLDLLSQLFAKYGDHWGLTPYDPVRGVQPIQEAYLRGHWLPDLRPAFPIDGFRGALATAAAKYGGMNSGMPANKLRVIQVRGDKANPALAAIDTDIQIKEDIGKNSGMTKSPRYIVRLLYPTGWETELMSRFNAALITRPKLLQAWAWAGDFGVGQRRPSSPHGGEYGTFRLTRTGEEEQAA